MKKETLVQTIIIVILIIILIPLIIITGKQMNSHRMDIINHPMEENVEKETAAADMIIGIDKVKKID